MLPTVTGAIVIVIGIWCQFGDYRRALIVMMVMILFEAADAADLIALGGASITPAKLFLGFFILRILSMRGGGRAMMGAIAPRRVMFLYLLLLVWVVASAILLPRLFQGQTNVFSLARSDDEAYAVPLAPSGGNITQSVYAIGSFLIALGFSVLGRRPGAYATVLTGFLVISGLDIFFAVVDLFTAATHTEFLLDVIHTGNYAFLTADESGGLKRISGSFAEASSFASFTLPLLAINVSLYLARERTRLTGFYSIALALFLLLSTSSTAYVGFAALSLAFMAYAFYALVFAGNARPLRIFTLAALCCVFALGCAEIFMPSFISAAWKILDVSLFSKGTSESAAERGALNVQAMKIFSDTYGLGAGIGSSRCSNYILVLASNLGVPGLVLFALLIIVLTCLKPDPALSRTSLNVVFASRVGLLTALVPAVLIGTIFDLGPLFYILAGVIASSTKRAVPDTIRGRATNSVPSPLRAKDIYAHGSSLARGALKTGIRTT